MNDYGGRREGAGRKTTWASGARKEDSKLVRVPEYIATEVLKAAHYIDAGGVINYNSLDSVTQSDNDLLDSVTQSDNDLLDSVTQSDNDSLDSVTQSDNHQLNNLIKLIERYKSEAKDTRDWSKANKLLTEALAILS